MMNAYTNGTDTIFGESAEEAVAAYRAEVGLVEPGDYEPSSNFTLVSDDKQIEVFEDDGSGRLSMTARDWINRRIATGSSRLIGTTDW